MLEKTRPNLSLYKRICKILPYTLSLWCLILVWLEAFLKITKKMTALMRLIRMIKKYFPFGLLPKEKKSKKRFTDMENSCMVKLTVFKEPVLFYYLELMQLPLKYQIGQMFINPSICSLLPKVKLKAYSKERESGNIS